MSSLHVKLRENAGVGGCLVIVLIYVVVVALAGWCWDYAISAWLVYAGKPDTFPYWLGCVCAVCPGLGQLAFPVALMTIVLLMFL